MRQEAMLVGMAGTARVGRLLGRALRAFPGARESAGLVVADEGRHRSWRPTDPAELEHEPMLDLLRGTVGIGSVERAAEAVDPMEAVGDRPRRPMVGRTAVGSMAVAMSGGFVGREALVQSLLESGALLESVDDTELLAQVLARSSHRTPVNRIVDALWRVRGGFAAVILAGDTLVGVRDPRGIRPLVLGQVGESTILASDVLAVEAVGGRFVRNVAPGEMVITRGGRIDSVRPFPARTHTPCVLEQLRLASSRTSWGHRTAWSVRRQLGVELAREAPLTGELVVACLPGDEALAAGFAAESGGRWASVLDGDRAIPEEVAGRCVVLVCAGADDGRAAQAAVGALTMAGASEVHVRLALALAAHGCLYGVSVEVLTPREGDEATLAERLGGASAVVLSAHKMREAVVEDDEASWCAGCVTGVFPEPEAEPDQLGLFQSEE